MAKKAIVKLLEGAMKGKSQDAVLEVLNIQEDEFKLYMDGDMEFSPVVAKAWGEALGIDPRKIMSAQMDDQFEILGVPAAKAEKVNVAAATQEATGTSDGQPARSPMTRERGMVKVTLPEGCSSEQATKTVRAVIASFAE